MIRVPSLVFFLLASACGDADGDSDPVSGSDSNSGDPSGDEGSGDEGGGDEGGGSETAATGDAGSDEGNDSDEPVSSCDGVLCAGLDGVSHGTCFLDVTGTPACSCDTDEGLAAPCSLQRIPTADLLCLTRDELCENALGFSCIDKAEQAFCRPGVESAEVCPENCASWCGLCVENCDPDAPLVDNVPSATCECQNAQAFDPETSTCIADVSACEPLMPNSNPLWDLQVTGDAEFRVVDGTGADDNWGDAGFLQVFNSWPESHCGTWGYSGGTREAGEYDVSSLAMFVIYDETLYESDAPGAGGTVEVTQLQWCSRFDCTDVDLTIDATLAAESGQTVQVTGYVRGTF